MKDLNRLLIIPLKRCSGEEHVRDFSESQGSMRIKKFNISWNDVDIPFSKIGVRQDKQINDISETKRDT